MVELKMKEIILNRFLIGQEITQQKQILLPK